MNNGAEIPKPDQMHVRIDYDLERGVNINFQFGLGTLVQLPRAPREIPAYW